MTVNLIDLPQCGLSLLLYKSQKRACPLLGLREQPRNH